jgi:hypothetical protein
MLRCAVQWIFTDVSGDLAASIIVVITKLIKESVSSSETLIIMYKVTQCYIPEDSHLCSSIEFEKQRI